MLKGIVFDLDGTLVDSLATTFEAFNHGIVSQGGRLHTPQEIIRYFGPGEGEIFAQILGPEKAAAAYTACRAYMDENVGKIPFHEGIDQILKDIRSEKIPVSIVTGRSWNTTEIILKYHGVMGDFVTVICNDHVNSPKPSPEGILLALQRMRLQPNEICYVGDSWVDTHAAKRAGATSIACLWDLMANREEIAPYQPHYWTEKPSHFWSIWEKLKYRSQD